MYKSAKALIIGMQSQLMSRTQEITQSSTCLCLSTVISCTTPGDFHYQVEPFGQTYFIQTTSRKVCTSGILFQSTNGVQFYSSCPKGSNSNHYQGTYCSSSPPTTGKKSLIYPQMSNDNTTLKSQTGNDGHLMKQWCGVMEWQGIFTMTQRC